MAKIRLDKYISSAAFVTRSEAKKLIHSGKVRVGEAVIKDEAFKVDEDDVSILLNGKELTNEKFVYIMLNKPAGVISATEDKTHTTVIDLLKDEDKKRGLFPAGRLDIDTEGLLILTNDGDFAHNTLSPKKHVTKKYLAHVSGYVFSAESAKRFADGIELSDGTKCKPAKIRELASLPDRSEVEIEITEGKYHQVKRMFAAEGGKVVYLKRLSFGEITLDEKLKPGEYRRLNADEAEYAAKQK